jgi:hypothetical protein
MAIAAALVLGACGSGDPSPSPTSSASSTSTSAMTTASSPPVIAHYVGMIPQEGSLPGIMRDAAGVPSCSAGRDSVHLVMNADVRYGEMLFYASMKDGGAFVIDYKHGAATGIKAAIINGTTVMQMVPGEGDPASQQGSIILEYVARGKSDVTSAVLCIARPA